MEEVTENVELCRLCGGRGVVLNPDFLGFDFMVNYCPICEGSGRVVRTKEIKDTVRPFKEKTDRKVK